MSTEEVLHFSSIEVVQMVRAERDGIGERLYLNFEFEMGWGCMNVKVTVFSGFWILGPVLKTRARKSGVLG